MPIEPPGTFAFGEFELDVGRRRLSRLADGCNVPLAPKAIEVLSYLVEHRHELLSKEALLAALWPNADVEENSLTQVVSGLRRALGEARGENRYIATLPGRGYRFVSEVARRATGPRRTLAVLAFRSLVSQQRNEALELGMTETLITSLNALATLSVCPLGSVRAYAELDCDPLLAGKELGVEFVLDGSLQHQQGRLRILMRLIRVEDNCQVWTARFDEDFTTIFDLQDTIAAKVTEALTAELAGRRRQPLVRHHTRDPEAYRRYTSGRLAWSSFTPVGFQQAIQHFNAAIALDGRYALAYAGLSDCYALLAVFQIHAPHSVFPHARAAASKALELDPLLAEAHVADGHAKAQYENNLTGAQRAYSRALALDSQCRLVHLYRGILLSYRGEVDSALTEIRRAQQLEPLWAEPRACAGMLLYFGRRYEEAIDELEQTLAVDERSDHARSFLGRAYLRTGQLERGLAAFRACRHPTPGGSADLGSALALLGRRAEAEAELESLLRAADERYVSAYDIASIYASLEETDNALNWIDRAVAERSAMLGWLGQDPAFDTLHGHARFAATIGRLGKD